MNLLPISWKESCAVRYTSLPFSPSVSFLLHFHIVELSSVFWGGGGRQKYLECTQICNVTGKRLNERNIWKTKTGTEPESLFWKELLLGLKAG